MPSMLADVSPSFLPARCQQGLRNERNRRSRSPQPREASRSWRSIHVRFASGMGSWASPSAIGHGPRTTGEGAATQHDAWAGAPFRVLEAFTPGRAGSSQDACGAEHSACRPPSGPQWE